MVRIIEALIFSLTIFTVLFIVFVISMMDNEIKALKQENNELKIDLEISSICNDLLKIK